MRTGAGTLLILGLGGCAGGDSAAPADDVRGAAPQITLPSPALRRLTESQYHNAATDLLGAGLVMPTSLEPDAEVAGLLSVGAATNSVSSYGIERYESAAYLLAEQVFADPDRAAALLTCTPAGEADRDCAAAFVTDVGRRAWRRPLSAEEIDRLSALLVTIGAAAGDFSTGATYALAAILQSPHFLYRVEHGVPDSTDPTRRPLGDWELATRLSFLLWNSIPDEELLLAAEAGELQSLAGLEQQARRLLADDRARDGIRNLFTEILHLYALDDLSKDPTVFTHANPDLADSAKEETLLLLEQLILEEDADFREILLAERTFVDRRLAALYGVAAPSAEGFAAVALDPAGGRRGLLGQASFLALQAHPASSSATLRGVFIREVLLCQDIPAPPANVNTSIPEADQDSPTLRERLTVHLEDPSCAGCHQLTDLVGLGLENFDGIGRWRDTENDAPIDPSGTLDGAGFADAWSLAGALAEHPSFGPCMTAHLYRYTTGREVAEGEEALVDWLADGFAASGYSYPDMLLEVVLSEGFRTTGAL